MNIRRHHRSTAENHGNTEPGTNGDQAAGDEGDGGHVANESFSLICVCALNER